MLKKPSSFISQSLDYNILFRIYKRANVIISCKLCIFHNTNKCPYEKHGFNCRQFDTINNVSIPKFYVNKKA